MTEQRRSGETKTVGQRGFYPGLAGWLAQRHGEWPLILRDRRAALHTLASWVRGRIEADQPAQLVFICTHNSRRSQMAQILARTAAHVYGLEAVECFSGGTEVSAFNPRAVEALDRAGFSIEITEAGDNPVYAVSYSPEAAPIVCFSKTTEHPANPGDGFCAVMTCSAADAACPVVPGASNRINIRYDDPKDFDGTAQETAKYDERCRQIAGEMLYSLSLAAPG